MNLSPRTNAALPNLLIVGVPKAGTGSLFAYLKQHPDICGAAEKEIGYFTPLRLDGGALPPVSEYVRFFSQCGEQRYRMEATPSYCFGGRAVRRAISEVLQRPRCVIILREPVDRLWSAYTFQRSLGHLAVSSFEEYVSKCAEQHRTNDRIVPGTHLNGLSIGFYEDYVPAWLDEFGSGVHVLFFDQLASDPRAVVAETCRWLAIDDAHVGSIDLSVRNRTVHPRSVATARVVSRLKSRAGDTLEWSPLLRTALRNMYFRLNRSPRLREGLDPNTRERLEAGYAASNAVVAEALRRHGYSDLPTWLTG